MYRHAGMGDIEVGRLRSPEEEIRELKLFVAHLSLDMRMLQFVL